MIDTYSSHVYICYIFYNIFFVFTLLCVHVKLLKDRLEDNEDSL